MDNGETFTDRVCRCGLSGNARANIYHDDEDRDTFLTLLQRTCDRHGWLCHSYCLMGCYQEMKSRLIIFDLFGTLVKFGIYRHPFRQLLVWARDNGRKPLPDDARTIMTIDGDIHQIAEHMRINAPAEFLLKLAKDIESELASLTLYEDVIPVLDELQRKRIPLAICSNLAQPYGVVIDQLLENYDLKLFLSYECGLIKPDVSLYQKIIVAINIKPEECLFVGDSFLMDCLGPREFGMQSLHLQRQHVTINTTESITTLLSILKRFS